MDYKLGLNTVTYFTEKEIETQRGTTTLPKVKQIVIAEINTQAVWLHSPCF